MAQFCRQLGLLLKKNYLIRRRQKVLLAFELLTPLALFAILVLVRTRKLGKDYPTCHYDSKALPGAGILPFVQSILCTFTNRCFQYPTSGNNRATIVPRVDSSLITVGREIVSLVNATGSASDDLESLLLDTAAVVPILSNLKVGQYDHRSIPISSLLNKPDEAVSLLSSLCGVSRPAAKQLVFESELKPGFGRVLLKIFISRNLSFDSIPTNIDAIVKDVFCNKTNVRAMFVSNNYPLLQDFCHLNVPCALVLVVYVNTTNAKKAANLALHNVTGTDISIPDAIKLVVYFQNLRLLVADPSIRLVFDRVSVVMASINDFNKVQNPNTFYNDLTCGEYEVARKLYGQFTKFYGPKSMSFTTSIQNETAVLKTLASSKADKQVKCGPINTVINSFCAKLLNGYVQKKVSQIIEGYILVSPDCPIVRDFVEKMRRPFDYMDKFRSISEDLVENDVDYQKQLNHSQISVAIMNSFKILTLLNSTVYHLPFNGSQFEFINGLLNDSNNPPAFFPSLADAFRGQLFDYLKCARFGDRFVILENERILEKVGVCLREANLYFSAIVFPDLNENSTDFENVTSYKIRMDPNKVDTTYAIRDSRGNLHSRNDPLNELKYVTYGFSFLQDMIERNLIGIQTNKSPGVGVYLQQFPGPCYYKDEFKNALSRYVPLLTFMSFAIPFALVVYNVVYEKERRLKEVMKVMGLGNLVHWLAWAIQSMSISIVTVILMLMLLKFGGILPQTDWSVLLIFLIIFNFANVVMAFAISTLFDQANVAAAASLVLYFIFFLPYGVLFKKLPNENSKIAFGILPQTALAYGMKVLSDYEAQGDGISWSSVGTSFYKAKRDRYAMSGSFLILVADIFIYSILTWYIETVFPGRYGIPRPFYFPFQRSYWCEGRAKDKSSIIHKLSTKYYDYPREDFEPDPEHLTLGVSIENLRKVYSNGLVAVDRLTVNFYENQITSFLGHNGAGKTTTMSILCGLFPATAGLVEIYGKSLRNHIHQIRQSLGFCPQHNVLFDKLGVEEQLKFYAGLKGVRRKDMKREMERILTDVGLKEKRKELAKNLSGGMQRKLSIAIAFIGNSRVVILDEPTAGVDPYARRTIWDLIIRYKQGRTIILSTHHMDEAELLGDRIAIVVDGKLRCAGSGLFLRSRFGSGYRLTVLCDMERSKMKELKVETVYSDNRESAKKAIKAVFGELMPSIRCIESVGAEMIFSFPKTDPTTLKDFFIKLDQNLSTLGILTYGISDTTLEEVFLKTALGQRDRLTNAYKYCPCCPIVNRLLYFDYLWGRSRRTLLVEQPEEDDTQEDFDRDSSVTFDAEEEMFAEPENERIPHPDVDKITNKAHLLFHRVKALLLKRFHNWKRSKKLVFVELIVPVLLLALAMLLIKNVKFSVQENQKPLLITISDYTNKKHNVNYVFYGIESKIEPGLELFNSMLNYPSLGIRCLPSVDLQDMPCVAAESKWTYPDGHAPFNYNVPMGKCGCQPDTHKWSCHEGAYKPRPRRRLTNSSNSLVDLTNRNISQWILMTYFDKKHDYLFSRYGGFQLGQIKPKALTQNRTSSLANELTHLGDALKNFSQTVGIYLKNPNDTNNPSNLTAIQLVTELVTSAEVRNAVKVWFFNKGYIALPAYANAFSNVLLRTLLPEDIRENYGIALVSHPMNYTPEERRPQGTNAQRINELFFAILVILAFSIVPASFVLLLIDERVNHSKHLQIVSGIRPKLYWISNFIWDMTNFMLPVILVIIVLVIFDAKPFVRGIYEVSALFMLLVCYGLAIIPMMYIFTFIFSVPPWAFILLSGGNFFVGTVSTLTVSILRTYSVTLNDKVLERVGKICSKVFLIFPQYCLGSSILDFQIRKYQIDKHLVTTPVVGDRRHLYSWQVFGSKFTWLICQGLGCFAIVLIIEYWGRLFSCFKCRRNTIRIDDEQEDFDVKKERKLVENCDVDKYGLVIRDLFKVYGRKRIPAVDHVSLSIERGQCFGLLGLNGAGKTTMFKMITDKITFTGGEVIINGLSVRRASSHLYQVVGYCPQFDALNGLLSGREQLAFYARIRGIKEKHISTIVDWAICHMHLSANQHNPSDTYSGGNRRKLSTAIALIGNPLVVLLDEPSTGMDPKTRRFMWNRIIELTRSGHTVVITSHSMEECEAVCSRVGIMVDGRLKCIGSVQHLKKKFGEGYRLLIKLSSFDSDGSASSIISEELPSAKLESQHYVTLNYRIPAGSITVAEAFAAVERIKSRINVADYALSQTTLDDVFVNFAAKFEKEKLK